MEIATTPAAGVNAPALEDHVVVTAPTLAPIVSAFALEEHVVVTAPTSSVRPSSPDFDALSASNEAEHGSSSGSGFDPRFEVRPSTTTMAPPSSSAQDAKEVDI